MNEQKTDIIMQSIQDQFVAIADSLKQDVGNIMQDIAKTENIINTKLMIFNETLDALDRRVRKIENMIQYINGIR